MHSTGLSRIVSLLAALSVGGTAVAAEQPGARPDQVIVAERGKKIAQLIGDFDRELNQPTANLTATRYKLAGTDLGVSFRHKDRIYFLFGDTAGIRGGDAIAYTAGKTPEEALQLTFIHDKTGYKPIEIPGISQEDFEVPMEGTSVGGKMYVYHTTDHSSRAMMGRSVVTVSQDDGHTFTYLYDLSMKHFINVSIVETDVSNWWGFPESRGIGLVIFGSGDFRRSDVRLAFQRASAIESPASIRYFAGLDGSSRPVWTAREDDAVALFHQTCVGELSVSYNRFIKKWIMFYNCDRQRESVLMRAADLPWGPWSEPQEVFNPATDGGFCRFVHMGWQTEKCDAIHDLGKENVTGACYAPYQVDDLAVGDDSSTTIYFTLSTWNPYTVVLMRTTLGRIGTSAPTGKK